LAHECGRGVVGVAPEGGCVADAKGRRHGSHES
jgi:hypothetical protein